eukprot:CAMPEP_0185752828 /NCGR_PEP_ID=MMETSP1174-20130828/11603_1 /TAXON_ID=35687 /ORGANISM="Dictyocha speculum, Strain CCMP1381" /LENGTH=123 /DNA_ID=CAMNT_0028430423 /DNA_START=103 /DNA_END=470 /DNA_ORIENTATION=+
MEDHGKPIIGLFPPNGDGFDESEFSLEETTGVGNQSFCSIKSGYINSGFSLNAGLFPMQDEELDPLESEDAPWRPPNYSIPSLPPTTWGVPESNHTEHLVPLKFRTVFSDWAPAAHPFGSYHP